MIILLYTVHVLICFFLIAVVLLQQGKGADLSVFGGGATQTAFGARGAATVLHKMTVVSFVLFIVTTLGIGIVQSDQGASDIFKDLDEAATTTSTEDDAAVPAVPAEAAAEEPAGAFAVDSTDEDAAGIEDAAAPENEAGADATADEGAPVAVEAPSDSSQPESQPETASEDGSGR